MACTIDVMHQILRLFQSAPGDEQAGQEPRFFAFVILLEPAMGIII